MNIIVRNVGSKCVEVKVNTGDTEVNLGLLDKEEARELAKELAIVIHELLA